MNTLELLVPALIVIPLALLLAALVRVVRSDGYGVRPPPASHLSWTSEVDGSGFAR